MSDSLQLGKQPCGGLEAEGKSRCITSDSGGVVRAVDRGSDHLLGLDRRHGGLALSRNWPYHVLLDGPVGTIARRLQEEAAEYSRCLVLYGRGRAWQTDEDKSVLRLSIYYVGNCR